MSDTMQDHEEETAGYAPADDLPVGAERQPAADKDLEGRARRMGWRPEAEYRGDPARWLPAAEFIERGENELPILRERNRNLDGQVATLSRDLNDTKTLLVDLTERQRQADERAYQRLRREIVARRQEAVANADQAAFDAAETELREIESTAPAGRSVAAAPAATPPAASPSAPVQPDPAIAAWIERNSWFKSDLNAQRDAIALFGNLPDSEPVEERLSSVRDRIRKLYPHHFGNPRRNEPPMVEGATGGGPRGAAPQSFDTLPKDAKDQYIRYSKAMDGKGKPLTKDEWAAYYYEQPGV